MSSIDERVVEMKFKDSSFQAGVSRTLSSLKSLQDNLKLTGATKGLESLGAAADGVDLEGIKTSASGINPIFAALATVGVTALSRLTNAAMDFGSKLISNVMEPLFEGGQRRALNLEGARYSFKMLGIDAVQAMEDANYAVEGTAYSLDVAAKAASQLSASQVALGDDMKASLRGISGVAALTNSSYEDISEVFTKIAGQGRVMGDDLNRLGSRGMNAAAVLAKSFNTTEEKLRKMVSKGEISFKEFAKAMDDAYGAQAVSAAETYSGALGQMRTALARIGADIAAPKLEALRRIYNALAPAINGVKFAIQPLLDMFGEFQTMKADNIVAMLEDIVKVGFGDKNDAASPLVALQEGFRNIADSIMNVVRPIREAWNAVFPPALGGMIAKFAFAFRDFTGALKINGDVANVLKTVFTVLFSGLKLGLTAISGVLGVVANGIGLLFRLLSAIGGVFAPVVKYVIGFVAGLIKMKESTGQATNALDVFFGALKWLQGALLEPLIGLFKGIGEGLNAFLNEGASAKEVFTRAFTPVIDVAKKVAGAFGVAGDVVQERFGVVGQRLKKSWEGLSNAVKVVGDFFKPLVKAMGPFFTKMRDGFIQMFEGTDFNTVLATVNTGILLVFANSIRKGLGKVFEAFSFMSTIKKSISDTFENISSAVGSLTPTMEAMQKKIRADAILKIALSIAVLAGALTLMSMIEPERMISASAGLATVAGALLLVMNQMSTILATKGLIKMPLIAYSLILLGSALVIMATAVRILSGLSWEEILRGLGGFAVILTGLMIAAKMMSGAEKDIIKVSAALTVLSVALLLMASAVVILGKIKYETLIQGLTGIAIVLFMLIGAVIILEKNEAGITKAAGGLLAMAAAIGMLAGVVVIFGLIPWQVLTQGLLVLGVLLGGLVVTAKLLSANAGGMTKAAGGLLAMAFAIGMLVSSIVILGMINIGTLIQGLLGLAGAVAIMAFAAKAMSGVEKGAAGMIALAGALLIMSISLKVLSTIPLEGMLIGLLGLGALLLMLGFAATVLAPLAPQLFILAGALAVFGLAMALMAAAMLIFTIALAALGPGIIALVEGLKVFAAAADEIIAGVPAMLAIGGGLIVFGLGAAVAAIGIGLLGLALTLLGVGLTLIGAVGIIGATALTAVTIAIVNLMQYAGQLVVMGLAFGVLGAGLLVLGVAGVVAGIALIAIGAGILVIAVAFMALAPAMLMAGAAMSTFLPLAEEFVKSVPALIALGVGLGAFGAGAIVAALGMLLMGAALLVLGVGLMAITAAGPGAAKIIKKVAEEVAGLWGHAVNIGIVSAALGALGVALLALGAGLLLTGGGLMFVLAAIMSFVGMANLFGAAVNIVIDAIKNLAKVSGSITKSGAALATLGTAIGKLGSVSAGAALGILAITTNFMTLSSSATNAAQATSSASGSINATMATIIASINKLPPAVRQMTTATNSAFVELAAVVDRAGVRVQASSARLAAAVRSSVLSALNGARATASSGGNSVGVAIADGMVRGLNNGNARVASAARRVASNALAAAKRALDSHSPSRKFRKLGEDSDEGLILGFEGKMDSVIKTAFGLGSAAVDSLRKSLAGASDLAMVDANLNPTITPVIDLSRAQAGVKSLGRLMPSTSRLDLSSTLADAQGISELFSGSSEERGGPSVTNITYNQTNNSPKALSEAEIYRQTDSQIARLRTQGVGGRLDR